MKTKFKVKRSKGYQSYEVDVDKTTTVLEVLLNLQDNKDNSLAFRYSCRSGSCGSCAMTINKQARLACETNVSELVGRSKTITIDPMHNMPIIKDLVTDMTKFWDNINVTRPWLSEKPSTKNLDATRTTELEKSIDCIFCALCFSACPAIENSRFLGPAALLKVYRMLNDPRDSESEQRLKVLNNDLEKIVACTRCSNCDDVCPQSIRVKNSIVQTSDDLMKFRGTADIGLEYLKQKRNVLKG